MYNTSFITESTASTIIQNLIVYVYKLHHCFQQGVDILRKHFLKTYLNILHKSLI